jgi:hypothetical protein
MPRIKNKIRSKCDIVTCNYSMIIHARFNSISRFCTQKNFFTCPMRRTYLNFSQSKGIHIIGLAAILNFQKVTFGSIYSSNFIVKD